ncbi:MAG: hypothetical protein WA947_14380 [Phormidesmis sp.]
MSSLTMLEQGATAQPAAVLPETTQSTAVPADSLPADPLPADLDGQRLCEIFGRYLYCSIYADAPQSAAEKPQWHTQRRYRLKNRVLYRDWQDAEKLVGVRPGHTIAYALLDIDINSPYHPKQDADAIAHIEAALETIGITRTIRIRSSWSEGIHLYLPLLEPVKTFDLAVALKNCLVPQGFKLKQGHLECFPNVKAYGNIIKTEYLAHRLPLQPASGSCLLDEAFCPESSKLSDFLNRWDIAAAGQDIQTLQQALPLARKNRFKKVRNRLNKIESWKQDLETILAEGWSGHSQTNQLLKEFGCYGHVFSGHSGEALVDFIYQQAISSPGYEKWCRHQREIRMRSRVWATAIEKYYWPLGSYGKTRQTEADGTAAFNDLRAKSAQESIRAAIQRLKLTEALPQKITARAEAIRKTQASLGSASSSLETLYKAENKKLWHPDFYIQEPGELPVIPSVLDVSGDREVDSPPTGEQLEPSEYRELRTEEEIMKCESYENDASALSKTKFNSAPGVRGDFLDFPQPRIEGSKLSAPTVKVNKAVTSKLGEGETPALKKSFKKPNLRKANLGPSIVTSKETVNGFRNNGLPQIVADTITATQSVVQRLDWSVEQVRAFISKRFEGRRRAQLSDDEALTLLYYLQVQYLEIRKVAGAK